MIDINMLSDRFSVRRLNDSNADDILDFCRKNTLYYQYCDAEASKEQVLNDMHITPPGVDMSDKYYVGFFNNEEMVAVLDLIDGYPEPDIGYIGFFMMNKDLLRDTDSLLREETDLRKLVLQKGYDTVIADRSLMPLLEGLPVRLLHLPHFAVSGEQSLP